MSDNVYSEINLHITWHTKNSLPMITPMIEDRLYHYLTHKIIETPGAYLHAIGGIETAQSASDFLIVEEGLGSWSGERGHCL